MKLFEDRGNRVEEHAHQEEKSVVQVHGWAMGKERNPKKSGEEGRFLNNKKNLGSEKEKNENKRKRKWK